jgi:hypothetical protein
MEIMNRLIREETKGGIRVDCTQLYGTDISTVGAGAGRQAVSIMIKPQI